MEQGIENHESVLVCSVKAMNRACFVITVFLMRRYRWSLLKTLEFLNSRRPDLEMRPSFLSQLTNYEQRLYQRGIGPKSHKWGELSDNQTHPIENEELILRNTYLNSKNLQVDYSATTAPVDPRMRPVSPYGKKMLVWKDTKSNFQQSLCEENRDEDDLVNLHNPPKQRNHYTKHHSNCKSALKVGKRQSQDRTTKLVETRTRCSSQQVPG